jgi:hypothetical protein
MKFTESQIFRFCVALVALAMCALMLTGCFQSTRDEQTDQAKHRTESWQGSVTVPMPITAPDGTTAVKPLPLAVNLYRKVDETVATESHSESKAGLDPAAINSAVAGAVQTAISAALPGAGALMSAGKAAGTDWTSLITAATTLVGGAGAAHVLQNNRIKEAKADAEEGWSEAKRHQERAEQYALQIPPKQS